MVPSFAPAAQPRHQAGLRPSDHHEGGFQPSIPCLGDSTPSRTTVPRPIPFHGCKDEPQLLPYLLYFHVLLPPTPRSRSRLTPSPPTPRLHLDLLGHLRPEFHKGALLVDRPPPARASLVQLRSDDPNCSAFHTRFSPNIQSSDPTRIAATFVLPLLALFLPTSTSRLHSGALLAGLPPPACTSSTQLGSDNPICSAIPHQFSPKYLEQRPDAHRRRLRAPALGAVLGPHLHLPRALLPHQLRRLCARDHRAGLRLQGKPPPLPRRRLGPPAPVEGRLFIALLMLSLLSTAALVYSIASTYSAKDRLSFPIILYVVPRVWRCLMPTFVAAFALLVDFRIIGAVPHGGHGDPVIH